VLRPNPRRVCTPATTMNALPLSTRANSEVIEAAYNAWLTNPDSVDTTWRAFFQGFALGSSGDSLPSAVASGNVKVIDSYKQAQIIRYINAHRSHGHLESHLDPLGENPPPTPSSPSPTSLSVTATSTRRSPSRISKAADNANSATSSPP
jgi:2-oxoglutarate dehydrogenase complex dehydrogenase (E1) component-like enzyme